MTSSRMESEGFFQFDNLLYQEQLNKIIQPVLPQFDRLAKSYVYFNFLFLVLGCLEGALLLYFFTFLAQSSLLAFALASVFLTLFSYFIFRLYFQTAKPERLEELKNQFANTCKAMINYQEGIPELHMAVAHACSKLSDSLAGKEFTYFRPPSWLQFLAPSMESFSYWWHWHDVHSMRELLLLVSLEEHIKLVRCEPTSLDIHAALANAYVMLSTLYSTQLKRPLEGFKWLNNEKALGGMEKKFREMTQCAIEELKILSDYAPHDPWVHLQLAYSYQDLNMPMEEIREYETILRIDPDDRETLFKLGSLYFQQGMNAKGLRVYEELKHWNYKKAESLIKLYGRGL